MAYHFEKRHLLRNSLAEPYEGSVQQPEAIGLQHAFGKLGFMRLLWNTSKTLESSSEVFSETVLKFRARSALDSPLNEPVHRISIQTYLVERRDVTATFVQFSKILNATSWLGEASADFPHQLISSFLCTVDLCTTQGLRVPDPLCSQKSECNFQVPPRPKLNH